MKLENQFPTVEQSLKLKDFGITQFSMCWKGSSVNEIYIRVNHFNSLDTGCGKLIEVRENTNPNSTAHFTVAELSVMLGAYAETYLREDNQWSCGDSKAIYPTQAQASAARLIELLDTGILTAAECNERLLNS